MPHSNNHQYHMAGSVAIMTRQHAEIKIEKNIPIPKPRNKYPFALMDVGDSFFVPGKTASHLSGSIGNAMRITSGKFVTRNIDGGVRVWRVE